MSTTLAKSGYLGRYQAVRPYGPQGWGLPYILDRTRHKIIPREGEEWWRSPEGIWMPAIAGGAGIDQRWTSGGPWAVRGSMFVGTALGTLALNTDFVLNTSGNGVALRLPRFHNGKTLATVYYYVTAVTGTPTIDLQVRYTTTTTGPTGTGTLVTAYTDSPTGAGWRAVTMTDVLTDAAGRYYYILFFDANAATAGVSTTLATTCPASSSGSMSQGDRLVGYTTANGFSTDTDIAVPTGVVVFSDGSACGIAYTAITNTTSNSAQRGIYFTSGYSVPLKVWGLVTFASTINGAKVWEGASAGPASGLDLLSGITVEPLLSAGGVILGATFASSVTLKPGLPTRIVHAVSGATNFPTYLDLGTIATGTQADLQKTWWLNGTALLAAANAGNTAWDATVELTTRGVRAFLLIEDDVMPGPLIGGGKLVG